MKLVLCEACWDVFKLSDELRQCKCGKVKGKYLNNIEAEVSKDAVSIAIGNGSLENAIEAMRRGNHKLDREQWIDVGKISHAWVRPNEGDGNPHCRVIED